MYPKPRQTLSDFQVGDKVTMNSFHNLFSSGEPRSEHMIVGTVIDKGGNGVAVDWDRRVRHPAYVPGHEHKNSCYWHLPIYLDKFNPFQHRIMEYVTRELAANEI